MELISDNTTPVEFHLTPVGNAVRVAVVESGFTAIDARQPERERTWKSNVNGWQEELAKLAAQAEQQ